MSFITVIVRGRIVSPSNFSNVEKMIRLMLRFNPMPIASLATNTSYFDWPELNNFACSLLVSGGKLPLQV